MLYPYRKSTWAVILFLLVIWPAFSVWVSSNGDLPAEIKNLSLEIYLPTLLIQLLLILMVLWALLRAREKIGSVGLVGINRQNTLIGIFFLVFATILFSVLSQVIHGLDQPKEIEQYLPKTGLDYSLWIILSLSAAIGEELSFRGFLLTRLTPVLGNFWAAALLSSISFGIGHLYQGAVGVIFTGMYGFLFAILFYWRKSIYPCMIAHFLQDALAPLIFSLTQSSAK
jgi:membrane protease YdiL (CAAX protease family)